MEEHLGSPPGLYFLHETDDAHVFVQEDCIDRVIHPEHMNRVAGLKNQACAGVHGLGKHQSERPAQKACADLGRLSQNPLTRCVNYPVQAILQRSPSVEDSANGWLRSPFLFGVHDRADRVDDRHDSRTKHRSQDQWHDEDHDDRNHLDRHFRRFFFFLSL